MKNLHVTDKDDVEMWKRISKLANKLATGFNMVVDGFLRENAKNSTAPVSDEIISEEEFYSIFNGIILFAAQNVWAAQKHVDETSRKRIYDFFINEFDNILGQVRERS